MLISRFKHIKGTFQFRQLNIIEFNTLKLNILIGWLDNKLKILLT
jgi:hypothetical protein